MNINQKLIQYYKERAKEYERIYAKPERQEDIRKAAEYLKMLVIGQRVLEIACGTGFWTQFISTAARSILATDINAPVIDIARSKGFPDTVEFRVADMFIKQPGTYDVIFGGFIFSHILKQDRKDFFSRLKNLCEPGTLLILMDNRYVERSNHPITGTDEAGNTFQTRYLDDGSAHNVLKNFPDEAELRESLIGIAESVDVKELNYFWMLWCGF